MAPYMNRHDWTPEPAVYGEEGYYRTSFGEILNLVVTRTFTDEYEVDVIRDDELLSREYYDDIRTAKRMAVFEAKKLLGGKYHKPYHALKRKTYYVPVKDRVAAGTGLDPIDERDVG